MDPVTLILTLMLMLISGVLGVLGFLFLTPIGWIIILLILILAKS